MFLRLDELILAYTFFLITEHVLMILCCLSLVRIFLLLFFSERIRYVERLSF